MDAFATEFNRQLVSAYKSVMRVEELMLKDLSSKDLSISEMHVLESVGLQPAGMHITDIAIEQGITLPSVTTSVQRLEKKGYVTKTRNASDGRRVLVQLTEKGRRAEIAHRYFHRQMVHAVLKGMSEQEQKATLDGLTKLNNYLSGFADGKSSAKGAEGSET